MHLMGGGGKTVPSLLLPLAPMLLLVLPLELPVELPLVLALPLAPPADAAASARIELVPRHDGQRQSLFVSSSDRIDLRDDWVISAGEVEDEEDDADDDADEDIGFIGIITVAGDDDEAAATGSRMLGGGELLGRWAEAGAVSGALLARLPLVLAEDDNDADDAEDEVTVTPASSRAAAAGPLEGHNQDKNVSEMDGAWCARYAAEDCGELGVVTDAAAVVVLADVEAEEDEAEGDE